MPDQSKIRKSTRWLLVVVALGLSLTFAELALRFLGLPREAAWSDFLRLMSEDYVESDDELFWRLKPGSGIFFGNELGLRGYLPPRSKRRGDLRIVCVGDSCTFGAGVRYEDTFGVQVERALQRASPDRRVDVLLGAIFGHSSHQNRILFERRLIAYAPDVTVFYCGLYNDWVPAVGRTDRERSNQLRLLQVLRSAFETQAARDTAQELFESGQRPARPRVSLPEFRDNLESMIESAVAAGSEVVVILPPRAQSMESRWPFGLEYVQAARDIATALDAHLIDAPKLVRAYEARAARWRDEQGYWPAFVDEGHPSVLGHRLIAQSLIQLLSRELDLPTQPRTDVPRSVTVDRHSVDALSPGALSVRGVDVGSTDRAWLGDAWLPHIESVREDQVRIELPSNLVPGEFELELRTDGGLIRAEQPVTVLGPALNISITRVPDSRVLIAADGSSPEGWHVFLWLSGTRLSTPTPTRFGPFELEFPAGRPDELPDAPFLFRRLQPALVAEAAEDGTWRIEAEVDARATWPDSIWAQALLVRSSTPWIGLLTQAATTDVR